MKKLLFLLFLFTALSNAQSRIEEYKASNGITYKEGDPITLGLGSGVQGTFVYLKMAGIMADPSSRIGSAYAGVNVIVKKIKKIKFKGAEKIIFTVGGGNITNYSLEIEEAIATCEIKDCNSKAATPVVQSNKFDDLKKLKSLHDEGVLSKEEYDVEKQKLLKQ